MKQIYTKKYFPEIFYPLASIVQILQHWSNKMFRIICFSWMVLWFKNAWWCGPIYSHRSWCQLFPPFSKLLGLQLKVQWNSSLILFNYMSLMENECHFECYRHILLYRLVGIPWKIYGNLHIAAKWIKIYCICYFQLKNFLRSLALTNRLLW